MVEKTKNEEFEDVLIPTNFEDTPFENVVP
jgi:hypothetical protein